MLFLQATGGVWEIKHTTGDLSWETRQAVPLPSLPMSGCESAGVFI